MTVTRVTKPRPTFTLALRGAGGEPVDPARTFLSHGVAGLPPMRSDEGGKWFEVTLRLRGAGPRTVRVEQGRPGRAAVWVSGGLPGPRVVEQVRRETSHVLRLDEDLSQLYALMETDPDLGWAAAGAGRMIRSQTVFEEVVKTVATTNCTWAATERMVTAFVEHLGETAVGARTDGPWGRAFPTAEAMAAAGEPFYRDVARAGYRAAYFAQLATDVAEGSVDLEAWGRASPADLPDEELEKMLLGLPGVGPYAATHIMMMLGRYSKLILDSWTRPTYARLAGKKKVSDAAIARRFKRYGRWAGLAFWLFLTEGWVERVE